MIAQGERRAEIDALHPVFLHSMWRTGSTYAFGKFRENERYYCYMEPLNEFLADLTPNNVSLHSGEATARQLGHTPLDKPYFQEFVPLVDPVTRRLAHFSSQLAVHRFFRAEDLSLQKYLAGLISYSQNLGRQPLLQFCRSYGRLDWMHSVFPGRHIYLMRNPRDQWKSYLARSNSYFMPLTCAIAALRGRHSASLSRLLARPLPSPRMLVGWWRKRSFQGLFKVARKYEASLDARDKYRIFYHEWCSARHEAFRYCDSIIDMNALSRDANLRRRLEAEFSIRLNDCRLPSYEQHDLPPEVLQQIEQEIKHECGFSLD